MRPVICLITPSSSVASGVGRTAGDPVARLAAAARAGVHLLQIRQPGADGGPVAALAGAALAAVRGTGARVVVNDRLDVALAVGAHGVHLRADSPPASRVRAAAPPGFLIGRSVHTLEEAQAAAAERAVDYLLYGTVFATDSKPGVAAAGTERLAAVCAAVGVPVLAVGGMAPANLGAVAAAGADGFAAIGLFALGPPEGLRALVGEAVAAFDTPVPVP